VLVFILVFMIALCCALSWQWYQCSIKSARDTLARERSAASHTSDDQQKLLAAANIDMEFTSGHRRASAAASVLR